MYRGRFALPISQYMQTIRIRISVAELHGYSTGMYYNHMGIALLFSLCSPGYLAGNRLESGMLAHTARCIRSIVVHVY